SWVQGDRRLAISPGPVFITLILIENATSVVCWGEFRIEVDGFRQVFDGLIHFSPLGVLVGPPVVGSGRKGVDFKSLVIVSDCLVRVAFAPISESSAQIGVPVVWVDRDDFAEVSDGSVKVPRSPVGSPAVLVRIRVTRIEPDGFC